MLAMFANLNHKPEAAFTQVFVILIGGLTGLILAIIVFVRTVPTDGLEMLRPYNYFGS